MTTRLEPVDLLPCPFCGNDARTSTYETESLWSHDQVTYTKVFCDECDVSFATEPGYELEAPEAWNRRAAPAPDGMREGVADALMPWLKNYPPSTRRQQAIRAADAILAIIAKGEGRE
jgi:Lar family restriction alleviation protein